MKGFNFYLGKVKTQNVNVLSWNGNAFLISYEDHKSFFDNGNLLMLVMRMLQMCLGEELAQYSLTGVKIVRDPETGKTHRVSNAAQKLPDELRLELQDFIVKTELMKYYPEILADFDRYFKTVLSKSFNRFQDKARKRKDAAAKKQATKGIEVILTYHECV